MQNLCSMTKLHSRRPVRRHLIGIECVKMPIQVVHEEEFLIFRSFSVLWWVASWGETSSSASCSPVVVTVCSLLLPDFLLVIPCRCLWGKSQCGDGRECPSRSWIELVSSCDIWSVSVVRCDKTSDLSFSGSSKIVPLRKWTIRNSTCLNDSPAGGEKSGWILSMKFNVSGVYISDRRQRSQCPWLISVRASEFCICSSIKFISWQTEIAMDRARSKGEVYTALKRTPWDFKNTANALPCRLPFGVKPASGHRPPTKSDLKFNSHSPWLIRKTSITTRSSSIELEEKLRVNKGGGGSCGGGAKTLYGSQTLIAGPNRGVPRDDGWGDNGDANAWQGSISGSCSRTFLTK